MDHKYIKAFAPIIVLGLGIGGLIALNKTKPKPKIKPADQRGTLVQVRKLSPSTEQIEVVARGTVIPARQVILGPEVGGRVVSMNDSLVPGGYLRRGERVLRVDARDYRLALEQQAALVNRAETELQIEESRKAVAEKEWEKFGSKQGGKASPLATREPQLKTAKVAVSSARSGLKQARLRVSRTVITAPFNGVIRDRQVEMGQLVAPGAPVATLVGTDAYWVQVSVPVSQLTWFAIPGIGGAEKGAEVEIRQKVGDEIYRRAGHVVRLLGEVDPVGRMARVLVEIPNPLATDRQPSVSEGVESGPRLPLLLGSYVEVVIAARELEGVFAINREHVAGGTNVHLMTAKGTLDVRKIRIAWKGTDRVLVDGGLKADERLVVSPIPGPVPGMKLRLPTPPATTPTPDSGKSNVDDANGVDSKESAAKGTAGAPAATGAN